MFVRSTVIDADRARVDDGITFVRDRVLPLVAGLDGAVGLTMLVNRTTGQTETSTLWGTRSAMAASNRLLTSVRGGGGRPDGRSAEGRGVEGGRALPGTPAPEGLRQPVDPAGVRPG